MQIAPFAVLEAHARAEYARKYASVPQPRLVNVDTPLQFTAPRRFVCGGVGYRAPPLTYRQGLQLLITANALKDLQDSKVPADMLEAARHRAALLIRSIVVPRRRLSRLFYRLTRNPFRGLGASTLEKLLRGLTAVPDEAPRTSVPSLNRVTVDFMDAAANFARELPAWCGADGLPRSWAHYLYGLRHLERARARIDLRSAVAARAAKTDARNFREYLADEQNVAGWN